MFGHEPLFSCPHAPLPIPVQRNGGRGEATCPPTWRFRSPEANENVRYPHLLFPPSGAYRAVSHPKGTLRFLAERASTRMNVVGGIWAGAAQGGSGRSKNPLTVFSSWRSKCRPKCRQVVLNFMVHPPFTPPAMRSRTDDHRWATRGKGGKERRGNHLGGLRDRHYRYYVGIGG